MTHSDSVDRLLRWPRIRLANLPTPLQRSERMARHVDVDALYVKMDAETGFALGGNKVRKLEFELAPEQLEGVTCLITAGGPQSNHCRVTAAAAARLGLECVLVTQGPAPEHPSGNALLHRLFGAEILTVAERAERTPTMETVAERVNAEGGKAKIVPIGASTGLGSLGYALAAIELTRQIDALDDGCERTRLFLSSSSCGTLAGLLCGLALLERRDVSLYGVSADATASELRSETLRLAQASAELLAAEPALDAISLTTIDDQVGDGYGIATPASDRATADFGALEGIVLDPTYTAKAAAGMIDWIASNGVGRTDRVIFLHTGGHPGLLA